MKLHFNRGAFASLLIASTPFLNGCKNGVSSAHAEPAPIVSNVEATAISEGVPVNVNAQVIGGKPVLADTEAKPVPAEIKLSSNAQQIVKLAQAGVDESVMLSFVTNSGGTFNLGSEEIIYLKDLGVDNSVLTAMIEHDRAFAAAAPTPAPVPVPPTTAAEAALQQPAPQAATEAVAVAPPTEPVTVNYFYSSLAPYGSWVEVDGYGRCWQPTVVVHDPSWQPYSDRGHWVYTDCGWYWYSDYSWGYSTFHYGRWFRHHRYGWCWYPDTVWGPAWVTFRYSNDYCGWAPLPPRAYYRPGYGFTYYDRSVSFSFSFGLSADCYTFVPFSRFCDSHPYRYRAPRTRITNIYNNTTVINNYGSGNNNTVINHGIPVDRVASATHTTIRPVAVRETSSHPRRGEHVERRGSETVIYRPPTSSTLGGASRRDTTQRTDTTASAPSTTREGRNISTRGNESTRPTTTTTTSIPQRGDTEVSRRQPGLPRTETQTTANGNNSSQPTTGSRIPRGNERQPREASTTVSKPTPVIGSQENRGQERRQQPAQPTTSVQPRTVPTLSSTETVSRSPRETVPPGSVILRGNRERPQVSTTPTIPTERSASGHSPYVSPRAESPRARSSELPSATVVNPSPTVVAPSPSPSVSPRVERQESYRSVGSPGTELEFAL